MGMSDIEFKVEKERIEGGIREVRLEGYRADLDKARFETQRKWVEVDIARQALAQSNLQLDTAREKTQQLGMKLQQAKLETQIVQVELDMTGDRLTAIRNEQNIQFETLTETLRGMSLRLSEKREDNDHLRQELAARGFSSMPGSFDLRSILGV